MEEPKGEHQPASISWLGTHYLVHGLAGLLTRVGHAWQESRDSRLTGQVSTWTPHTRWTPCQTVPTESLSDNGETKRIGIHTPVVYVLKGSTGLLPCTGYCSP